jgi:hypothetical protein
VTDKLTPAEIRLAQYGQRTSTWSTATYNDGTEKALHEIALGLKEEIDRLRFRLAELGEQGPDDRETVAEAAQMYRSLRPVIERTMADPDRWDGDEDESFHLGRYVEWLAAQVPQTVPEEGAERLATLTDCPNSSNGGLHCLHYQEGDGQCCRCGRPNWCPDGGVA